MKKVLIVVLINLFCVLTVFSTGTEKSGQYIFFNPVFLPMGTAHVEYEHPVLYKRISIGLTAWHEFREVKARWYYAKFLYYFSRSAPKGVGIGPLTGAIWSKKSNQYAFLTGVTLQYNLFFGREERYFAGVGGSIRGNTFSGDAKNELGNVDGEIRLGVGMRL